MNGWHAEGRGVAATDACCHAAPPLPRRALPALLPQTRTRGAQAAPSTAGSRWPSARQTPHATLSCGLPWGTVWKRLPQRGGWARREPQRDTGLRQSRPPPPPTGGDGCHLAPVPSILNRAPTQDRCSGRSRVVGRRAAGRGSRPAPRRAVAATSQPATVPPATVPPAAPGRPAATPPDRPRAFDRLPLDRPTSPRPPARLSGCQPDHAPDGRPARPPARPPACPTDQPVGRRGTPLTSSPVNPRPPRLAPSPPATPPRLPLSLSCSLSSPLERQRDRHNRRPPTDRNSRARRPPPPLS